TGDAPARDVSRAWRRRRAVAELAILVIAPAEQLSAVIDCARRLTACADRNRCADAYCSGRVRSSGERGAAEVCTPALHGARRADAAGIEAGGGDRSETKIEL